jgi:hypothetical protein
MILAVAPFATAIADGTTDLAFPHLSDRQAAEDPGYSYYYVPRLSELNQLVGALFRSGRVHLADPGPAATITRYVAYSCEGTFQLSADADGKNTYNIDWARVTDLRSGPVTAAPSLVIETRPATAPADSPVVLYVADAAIRYELHQALAVLVTECRRNLWDAAAHGRRSPDPP